MQWLESLRWDWALILTVVGVLLSVLGLVQGWRYARKSRDAAPSIQATASGTDSRAAAANTMVIHETRRQDSVQSSENSSRKSPGSEPTAGQ